jgi:hypothetical protein
MIDQLRLEMQDGKFRARPQRTLSWGKFRNAYQ